MVLPSHIGNIGQQLHREQRVQLNTGSGEIRLTRSKTMETTSSRIQQKWYQHTFWEKKKSFLRLMWFGRRKECSVKLLVRTMTECLVSTEYYILLMEWPDSSYVNTISSAWNLTLYIISTIITNQDVRENNHSDSIVFPVISKRTHRIVPVERTEIAVVPQVSLGSQSREMYLFCSMQATISARLVTRCTEPMICFVLQLTPLVSVLLVPWQK